MRIAHIITRMVVGGAQENTWLTCRDLVSDFGDEVLLITGPSTGPEGSLLECMGDCPFPVTMVPTLCREISPYRDWQAMKFITRTLRQFRPDVVHTHSAKAGMLGRVAAHKLGTPAIVHTVHGSPFHQFQSAAARALFRQCEKYAAKKTDHLISVADAMTDRLVSAGVAPREKFTTIYSGMDMTPFQSASKNRTSVRRQLGYGDQHVVITKIARLFRLKGHEFLIEAAPAVVAACPDVRFLLVGDGVLRDKLQRKIDSWGLTAYFQFTGLVSPTEVPDLLAASDVVVHTSLREGLARVLPQAMLAERPVISYDIDGAREVVTHEKTGLLLSPQSIDELSQAMVELCSNPSLRGELGREGYKLCRDKFDHRTMTRQIRRVYEACLTSS